MESLTTFNVISHVFEGWNTIPNLDDVRRVKYGNVDFFARKNKTNKVSYVAYIVKDGKVVAFGSATHFLKKRNVYMDDEDDKSHIQYQKYRDLWIEGMVSIEKGCGSLVISKLEEWLHERSPNNPINLMSANQSIGFYDKHGYIDCYTSPYWRGLECTRMVKFIGDVCENNRIKACCVKYKDLNDCDDQYFCELLVDYVAQDRITKVQEFINIPVNRDLAEYVLDNKNKDDMFSSAFTNARKGLFLEILEDLMGDYVQCVKKRKLANELWKEKYSCGEISEQEKSAIILKIKSLTALIGKNANVEKKIEINIEMYDYLAEEGYKVCNHHATFKTIVKDTCLPLLSKPKFISGIKPGTRSFIFALTGNNVD